MITEKDTIKCESVFNDDYTHRFLWKRIWDKDKPMVTVIALNPSQADNIVTDTTTSLIVNNIAKLEEFGGVTIVNLYSLLTLKLDFKNNTDEELNEPNNDSFIRKAADESEMIILAWGKGAATNQRIGERVEHVLKLLKTHRGKLYVISDGVRDGIHPLTPSVRDEWHIKSFVYPAYTNEADSK